MVLSYNHPASFFISWINCVSKSKLPSKTKDILHSMKRKDAMRWRKRRKSSSPHPQFREEVLSSKKRTELSQQTKVENIVKIPRIFFYDLKLTGIDPRRCWLMWDHRTKSNFCPKTNSHRRFLLKWQFPAFSLVSAWPSLWLEPDLAEKTKIKKYESDALDLANVHFGWISQILTKSDLN